jgi:NADH:ubiquinone oxidoreductase subunit 4 (subunit M)
MKKFQDLNRFELYLLTPFVILTFLLGLFPDLVISYITIY